MMPPATRYGALSQPNVIASIPAAFVNNCEQTVEVAKAFRPIDKAGMHQLLEMAKSSESLFLTRQARGLAKHGIRHHEDDDYYMC